jgi:hypothetical protein
MWSRSCTKVSWNQSACVRKTTRHMRQIAGKTFPMELMQCYMQRMIPAERATLLSMVSKELRAAMGRVKPAARVKGKQAAPQPAGTGARAGQVEASMVSARAPQTVVIQPIALLERGLSNLQKWYRVTALHLSAIIIEL